MSDLITVEIDNHIADIKLNRPEKWNALSIELFEAITDTANDIKTNREVRAVVLSGNGPAFCAGLDVTTLSDPDVFAEPFGEGRGGYYPNFYQSPCYAWREVPVPVLCAMHGVAFGGGIQIALGADIRIAHPDTKMAVMEIKWGLIPDMSATQTLRDLMRIDVAKELLFSGRVLEAPEALDIGLVTRMDDKPYEACMEMAKNIAQRNPEAISLGKKLLHDTWHGDQIDGLKREEYLQSKLLKSSNQMEAVSSEMEKRTANFAPRYFGSYDHLDY